MKTAAIVVTCLVLCPCAVFGRSASSSKHEGTEAAPDGLSSTGRSLYVGCGFLLAENHSKTNNFTVLLKAEVARQVPNASAVWILDDVLVQTVVTDANTIGAPNARGMDLLKKYMRWETDFTAKKRGWTDLQPGGGAVDVGLKDIATMMWGYDAPSTFEVFGQPISRVLYATAAIDDVIFVVSAPMRASDDPASVGARLRKILATIRRSRRPVDVVSLSAQLKSGSGRWEGCSEGSGDVLHGAQR